MHTDGCLYAGQGTDGGAIFYAYLTGFRRADGEVSPNSRRPRAHSGLSELYKIKAELAGRFYRVYIGNEA